MKKHNKSLSLEDLTLHQQYNILFYLKTNKKHNKSYQLVLPNFSLK